MLKGKVIVQLATFTELKNMYFICLHPPSQQYIRTTHFLYFLKDDYAQNA